MRYLFSFLTTLAWALWFGGAMTLMILVVHLFRTDRALAIQAAPIMFVEFAKYQVLLAAAALLFSAIWRLIEPRALLTTIFILLAGSAIATVLIAAVITPRMETLRIAGETHTAQYSKLHGESGIAYSADAALLLLAGLLLPRAMRARGSVPAASDRATEAAPG
jgi:hypothetical protein